MISVIAESVNKADMRYAEISNIDIQTLDCSGVQISEFQMSSLLEGMGFIVFLDV
jgi:fluoroquinolone resistance protein